MTLATWLVLRGRAKWDQQLVTRLAAVVERNLQVATARSVALVERGYRRIVYLGSGSLTGLARESALKLLELTAGDVVSYWDSTLGFRHGPKSVLDDSTGVFVYVSNDAHTRRYDEDMVAELRGALGARNVFPVSARPSGGMENGWRLDGLDDVDDALLALAFAVGAQLFGLQSSLALGLDPDNPFPAGEVNRVVQGVTIHPFRGQ